MAVLAQLLKNRGKTFVLVSDLYQLRLIQTFNRYPALLQTGHEEGEEETLKRVTTSMKKPLDFETKQD